ncbi:YcxB family protein [Dactylosporangium siamense]|uniref:YcxB family protein n=1 Tax=Dactylosporangium siamense TaxID=685454 RepID=UPI0019416ED7|nr:YcxB family protein [Dactylosporangium siamense]
MHIEFTFARPQKYFRTYAAPKARHAALPGVLTAGVLVLLGYAVVGFVDDIAWSWLPAGPTVIGFFVIPTGYALWRAWRSYAALMNVPEFLSLPRQYRVDDEALHASTDLSAVTYRWPLVQTVWVTPEAYVFGVRNFGILDLPRVPLTEQQDAELRAFLAARGLLPADTRLADRRSERFLPPVSRPPSQDLRPWTAADPRPADDPAPADGYTVP